MCMMSEWLDRQRRTVIQNFLFFFTTSSSPTSLQFTYTQLVVVGSNCSLQSLIQQENSNTFSSSPFSSFTTLLFLSFSLLLSFFFFLGRNEQVDNEGEDIISFPSTIPLPYFFFFLSFSSFLFSLDLFLLLNFLDGWDTIQLDWYSGGVRKVESCPTFSSRTNVLMRKEVLKGTEIVFWNDTIKCFHSLEFYLPFSFSFSSFLSFYLDFTIFFVLGVDDDDVVSKLVIIVLSLSRSFLF